MCFCYFCSLKYSEEILFVCDEKYWKQNLLFFYSINENAMNIVFTNYRNE